jgi:hypothetical protein
MSAENNTFKLDPNDLAEQVRKSLGLPEFIGWDEYDSELIQLTCADQRVLSIFPQNGRFEVYSADGTTVESSGTITVTAIKE